MSKSGKVPKKPSRTKAKIKKPQPKQRRKNTAEYRPTQPAPVPEVKSKGPKLAKMGKGFSLIELREAQVPINLAKRLKLKIDRRRGSKHEANVKLLKDWFTPTTTRT